MDSKANREYSFVRNPLTVIAIFAGIAEVSGTIVLPLLTADVQRIFVWFVMMFPALLVVMFFSTLWFRHSKLYAPSDYRDDSTFLEATNAEAQNSAAKKKLLGDLVEVLDESRPQDQEPAPSSNLDDNARSADRTSPASHTNEVSNLGADSVESPDANSNPEARQAPESGQDVDSVDLLMSEHSTLGDLPESLVERVRPSRARIRDDSFSSSLQSVLDWTARSGKNLKSTRNGEDLRAEHAQSAEILTTFQRALGSILVAEKLALDKVGREFSGQMMRDYFLETSSSAHLFDAIVRNGQITYALEVKYIRSGTEVRSSMEKILSEAGEFFKSMESDALKKTRYILILVSDEMDITMARAIHFATKGISKWIGPNGMIRSFTMPQLTGDFISSASE